MIGWGLLRGGSGAWLTSILSFCVFAESLYLCFKLFNLWKQLKALRLDSKERKTELQFRDLLWNEIFMTLPHLSLCLRIFYLYICLLMWKKLFKGKNKKHVLQSTSSKEREKNLTILPVNTQRSILVESFTNWQKLSLQNKKCNVCYSLLGLSDTPV